MRMTYILPAVYTNSHFLIVARHMLAKQVVDSLGDLMYTIFLVGINTTSKFTQHLLEYSHYFGNMEITMQALYFNKKGTHMHTLEKF